jgi:hypothetical protein
MSCHASRDRCLILGHGDAPRVAVLRRFERGKRWRDGQAIVGCCLGSLSILNSCESRATTHHGHVSSLGASFPRRRPSNGPPSPPTLRRFASLVASARRNLPFDGSRASCDVLAVRERPCWCRRRRSATSKKSGDHSSPPSDLSLSDRTVAARANDKRQNAHRARAVTFLKQTNKPALDGISPWAQRPSLNKSTICFPSTDVPHTMQPFA